MKRFFPGAALLITLALTACTPAPDSEVSQAAELPYTEGQLYAAAWLGWQDTGDLSRYADLCPGIEEAPVLRLSDGEYWLICPVIRHCAGGKPAGHQHLRSPAGLLRPWTAKR